MINNAPVNSIITPQPRFPALQHHFFFEEFNLRDILKTD